MGRKIIISSSVFNLKETHKLVVVSDQLSYVEAIKSMLIKDIYEKLSVNCLNWAKNENKLIYLEDYRIRINTLMF